jgi:DNA replication protein DnaC
LSLLRAASPGSKFELVTTSTETCPICGGTGWQTIERGKEREAVRCECRVRDRRGRLLEAAHIPARYAACDLTNFNTEGEREPLQNAKRTAEQFIENYPIDKRGLLFVGPPGVGKTHLAVSILKRLMSDKGIQCRFVDYRELLKQIQYTYNPAVQMTELELLQPVFETEVVLLDELGAIRTSQWVWDTVSHILNNRYSENRTTLITSNFEDRPERSLEETERGEHFTDPERAVRGETLGDRIGGPMWSRLHEMCQKVDMVGRDYRRRFYSTRLVRKRISVKSHKDEPPPAVEEN